MDNWPFADPPNVATITLRQIVREGQPILLVTHDYDDGSWQFLTGGEFEIADGLVVSRDCILKRDPSVAELADLPLGWRAWREQVGTPWQREPEPEQPPITES
jgi:hypothetical protein